MPRRPLCPAHFQPSQITTSHSQPIKTVFTYQPLWGRHSVFKTDAQREGKEWPSYSPRHCKSPMICPFFFLLPQLYWKAISPSTTRHKHFNNSVNRERQILLSFYNHDFYVKEILSDGIKVHLLEYNFEVLESVDKCEFFTTSTPYTLLVMCSIYRNSLTWEFPFLCYFILELSHRGQYWKFYSLHLFDTLNDSSHCMLHQSASSTIRILIWS